MELSGLLQPGELAAAFARLPVFPLFDLGYFIVSVLYLKYESGLLMSNSSSSSTCT